MPLYTKRSATDLIVLLSQRRIECWIPRLDWGKSLDSGGNFVELHGRYHVPLPKHPDIDTTTFP